MVRLRMNVSAHTYARAGAPTHACARPTPRVVRMYALTTHANLCVPAACYAQPVADALLPEPILVSNPSRFVLFPIKHGKVRGGRRVPRDRTACTQCLSREDGASPRAGRACVRGVRCLLSFGVRSVVRACTRTSVGLSVGTCDNIRLTSVSRPCPAWGVHVWVHTIATLV